MHGSRKFSQGGGSVQIPRTGLTENFNMAKINNLAIPGGGGGGPDPLPPPPPPPPTLDPPMYNFNEVILCKRATLVVEDRSAAR